MISEHDAKRLIQDLNMLDETDELEAKEISADKLGDSVYETICALSNEPDLEGGSILLGVAKEDALFPLYTATGVLNPDKFVTEIATTCRTIFNHPISPKISTMEVDGVPIIRVDVKELTSSQKPLYIKRKGIAHGTYRRIGSSDVRCNSEDLEALFRGKTEQYDRSIVPDAAWNDIDPEAIKLYRRLRHEAHSSAEELGWSDEELVYALGGITYEGETIRPTLAGIISFGKQTALRRLFPSHRVDYIRVAGRNWIDDPDGNFDALDLRGPTISLVGRVIAAISDDLPKSLIIGPAENGTRDEVPAIPPRVVREAVVNSLMHRSYQVHEPVQIIRYANRLEIKNPGHSLKREDSFDSPGSVHRNPSIAEILHETRFAETKGSGIRVMKQMMEQSGLAPPSFESDRRSETFTGRLLFHHFLGDADMEWLARFSNFNLSTEKMKALIFIREVGAIDNSTYRSLNNSERHDASKDLRDLHDAGLIVKRGQSAGTYYVQGEEFLSRDNIDGRSDNIYGSVNNIDGGIYDKDGKRRSSAIIHVSDIPQKLRTQVRNIQLAKRNDPEKVMSVVEQLCEWKSLSTAELASLLGMTQTYVYQKYLGPMIERRKLEHTHPEMIKHPEQKYRRKR